MMTKDEGWFVLHRSREPRSFGVGEKIQLSKQDLFRIAATIFELVLSLRTNLYTHLRKTCSQDLREQQLRWTVQAVFSNGPVENGQEESTKGPAGRRYPSPLEDPTDDG
jgi:hypothetical protein